MPLLFKIVASDIQRQQIGLVHEGSYRPQSLIGKLLMMQLLPSYICVHKSFQVRPVVIFRGTEPSLDLNRLHDLLQVLDVLLAFSDVFLAQ